MMVAVVAGVWTLLLWNDARFPPMPSALQRPTLLGEENWREKLAILVAFIGVGIPALAVIAFLIFLGLGLLFFLTRIAFSGWSWML